MIRPLAVLFIAMATINLAAELQWDALEKKVQVHPTQVSAKAVFRFVNTGDQPLSITKVQAMCDCLVPNLQPRTVDPGEAGELSVELDLRNRDGHFRKPVVVETDSGTETLLYMEVDIPRIYSITPVMMKWSEGSTARTKTATLRNLNEQPIKLLSASSSHTNLTAVLIPVREGFEYEVAVTRQPAAQNARAVIRIQTESPPGQQDSRTLKLYVHAP